MKPPEQSTARVSVAGEVPSCGIVLALNDMQYAHTHKPQQ